MNISHNKKILEQLAHDKGLWAQIVRRIGDKNLAEDVLQHVLLIVYQKLPQLRDTNKLRPWVFQIMKNEVFKQLWQQKRNCLANESSMAMQTVSSQASDEELRDLLLGTLQKEDFFTKTERSVAEILIQQTLEGVDYKTILVNIQNNKQYDINYTTTLIYRIRKKLDKYLERCGYQSCLKARKEDDEPRKNGSKYISCRREPTEILGQRK